MGDKSEKKAKSKGDKKSKDKKEKKEKKSEPQTTAFSLLADGKAVDPTLSSLFAAKPDPPKPRNVAVPAGDDLGDDEVDQEDEDAENVDDEDEEMMTKSVEDLIVRELAGAAGEESAPLRKRKRKAADEELEDAYMQKLAREEDRDAEKAAAERAAKRQKAAEANGEELKEDEDAEMEDKADAESDSDDDVASPPPKHETQEAAELEQSKANRTVFLGNVSTSAIISKAARKTLDTHLSSFFDKVAEPKAKEPKHKLESLRFRSTPYDTSKPKKAAFARKELMDATTKSTNAYAVYSSPLLAREAATHLNGTVVLDRHLRVDAVAHPAKVDNRRCVFIGNLGFVDDETNIQDANEEEGRETRKRGKVPADVEEGLWRTFGKCGKVESVRVIRDSTTRVGKGIAYVQFDDENAVEAALLYDEKKFPPMLPRKLRVSRAKAPKKNAKPESGRPVAGKQNGSGYQRKLTGKEASNMGRAAKLYGRAAAAQQAKQFSSTPKERRESGAKPDTDNGIRKPEEFIFEGHRAKASSGKAGLKLGGKKQKTGKPDNRSAKRAAAYKASNKGKK
ncbi:Hypothetical protein R9X50_00012400 [Acrodontium crateriforme]|uniref:Nucleolar protein 12 n=1 Tax=Acrodontium crateriforme TaxID=150365 RepID=A0AAQ3R1U9_9PEZI|nr:Hypothetical protein R9X50_00012400 [Acrodontium crateriforme]